MPGIHVFFPDKVKSAECLLHGGEHPHLRLGPADILSAAMVHPRNHTVSDFPNFCLTAG
jgi:hypothetical protein